MCYAVPDFDLIYVWSNFYGVSQAERDRKRKSDWQAANCTLIKRHKEQPNEMVRKRTSMHSNNVRRKEHCCRYADRGCKSVLSTAASESTHASRCEYKLL